MAAVGSEEGENDFISYDSVEEDGLNDVYDNLPSDQTVESSDGLPTEDEEEETGDDDVTETDEEDVDPKNGKFRDSSHDPYEEWKRIAEVPEPKIDIRAVFLEDADLKEIWADQANSAEETEESDDDYDEDDMDEILNGDDEETNRRRSDEDEDVGNPLESSGDETDDGPTPLVEADTPIPLNSDNEDDARSGKEVNYEEEEEETEEESDFSIATDPDVEPEEDEEEETRVGDDEEGGGEGTEGESGEDEDENEGEEEDVEEIRQRKYRKVEKENEDDTTEWETITQPSENEAPQLESEAEEEEAEQEEEEEELEEENEEEEEIPKTPDPYGYTELHTNIEYIEEYDGGFLDKFKARIKTSAASSEDESGDEHARGEFDVHAYTLEEHKSFSVIKASKNYQNPNEETPRRRKISKRPTKLALENTVERIERKKTKKGKVSTKSASRNHRKKEHFIDLSVYDFHIPQFNSQDELLSPENPIVEESVKPVKKKRKEKVKKLKRRGFLDSTYERCHNWYADLKKLPEIEYPSASIPSYKVQARSRTVKERTVKLALDKVLNQTFNAIDDIEQIKLRKEANHNCQLLVLQLADDVVGEIEEQQQRNAVRYALEVLLDKWEDCVYTTRKNMIEQQLNTVSEKLVTSAISKVSMEVENEDRVASLVVRDALASSLDSLGKKRVTIHRKLQRLFSEYRFDDYDFDKGETKIKQKLHRTRRALDKNLKARRKVESVENTPRSRSAKRRQRRETKHLSQIEEDENSVKEEAVNKIAEDNGRPTFGVVKQDSDEDLMERDLIDLPSDALSEGEIEGVTKPTHLDKMDKVLDRQRRRSHVLNIWKETDREILTQLRLENERWNAMYEQQLREREQQQQEKPPENDYNAMYAASEDEEKNESETDDVMLEDKRMPNLEDVFQDALVNPEAEILIVPVKQGFKRAPPTDDEDSAVESSEENVKEESGMDRQRKSCVIAHQPIVDRRDTGISSLATIDEPLEGHEIENKNSIKDLIHLIPNIDRDQFLNDWLFRGGQQRPTTAIRTPTPPSKAPSSKQRERPRRFHLKRPGTADSQVSTRDVVPLDHTMLAHYSAGRLNSAKSTRSAQRPESAQSMYSERSSIYSQLEERAPSPNIESDEDEKKNISQRGQKVKPKNTKIKFHNEEQNINKSNEKFEKDLENSAWNFYVRQNRELRKLREKIEQEGRPQLLSDVNLPSHQFEEKDFNIILDKYGAVEINGMYEDEEEEIELLNLMDDVKDENFSEGEHEKDSKTPSISPPSTPWKRQKNRPMTPDSVDSDEELEKIKKKHYDMYKSKNEGPPKERLYKEFLRKKDTTLPPPPKLGWQPPENGLIKWKKASEDVKKVNRGKKGNKQDVSIALKRTLFNQLQLTMKKSERQKMVQENSRLLQRRATLHTEQLSLTNLEKRKKILPNNADPRSISPRSTRSIPSYARPTRAAALKERDKEELKLPKITNNKTLNKSSSKSVTSSRRKSTKPSKTAR